MELSSGRHQAKAQPFPMDDTPELGPGQPVGAGLRALAREILAEARSALEDPARSDAVAVHDFRRAMKRWRAVLRLLSPFLGPGGRHLRDEARDLARGLGGARDAQSALDALTDLAEHGLDLPKRSLAALRGRIEAMRGAAETATLDDAMRTRLKAALDDAAAAIEVWPVDGISFDDVADRIVAGYRQARRAAPEDWKAASGEALHELRKRIVTHRYQMDLVAPLWPRFSRMWTGECQRLRARLGQYQDLSLLAGMIAPHRPLARWHARLADAIEKRQAAHVAGAARVAARLFVEKPNALRRKLARIWQEQR
jgi:CHAD domain-containing protein